MSQDNIERKVLILWMTTECDVQESELYVDEGEGWMVTSSCAFIDVPEMLDDCC